MKKILIHATILLVAILSVSCKSNAKIGFKKVKNAGYEIYTVGEEKGYNVSFETYGSGIEPVAVVINRIRSDFSVSDKIDGVFRLGVIVHTMKIKGYRPQISNYKNGVIYKIGNIEKFIPVEFILKQ